MAKSVLCKFREIFWRKFPNVDFKNLLKLKFLSTPLKEYRVPFSKINGLTLERISLLRPGDGTAGSRTLVLLSDLQHKSKMEACWVDHQKTKKVTWLQHFFSLSHRLQAPQNHRGRRNGWAGNNGGVEAVEPSQKNEPNHHNHWVGDLEKETSCLSNHNPID